MMIGLAASIAIVVFLVCIVFIVYALRSRAAPQQDQSTHQEQPEFTPKSDIVSGVASVLGAFGGLLGGGASGGDEPQDTARQKRKKKKKRTRRID